MKERQNFILAAFSPSAVARMLADVAFAPMIATMRCKAIGYDCAQYSDHESGNYLKTAGYAPD
jgi:hypothetical protein